MNTTVPPHSNPRQAETTGRTPRFCHRRAEAPDFVTPMCRFSHPPFFSRHVFLGKKAPARNATPRGHGFFLGRVFLGKKKPLLGTLRRDTMAFYKKVSKMGPEKNCLRFWGILGCQVQNDLKTLGNRFLSRDLNFLKNDNKNWSH